MGIKTMRFKVDENLPDDVAKLLQNAGHDAATAMEQGLSGSPDADIARACCDEERALISLDLDFGDIRAYPPEHYAGLVILRLTRQDKATVLQAIERILPLMIQEPLTGRLWVVDERALRIRGEDE